MRKSLLKKKDLGEEGDACILPTRKGSRLALDYMKLQVMRSEGRLAGLGRREGRDITLF